MITFLINIFIIIMNSIYIFFKLLPVQNKIVMISRQSNNINLDFKLIEKELSKKHKVVNLCRTLKGGAKAKFKDKISYGFHMFRQMYHLATSKICILDSYCPTVSILHHKKKLTIIQIWHSIGSMKKFGYRILDKKEGSNYKLALAMKMHKNYTYAISSSKAYIKDLSLGFNLPEKQFKVATLPRVDLLQDRKYEEKVKEKIYKEYPSLQKKKNILYAPTFRKDERDFYEYLIKLIDAVDFKKYNLIIKLHPLSKTKIESDKSINDKKFSTFDMLFVADYLISDYSCIIYEAGIRNIPLYFYNYDIEKYLNDRGMAINYEELPGFKEKDAKKLVKDLEKKYDFDYQKKFIKKYVTNTKNCTKKIVKEIEKYF